MREKCTIVALRRIARKDRSRIIEAIDQLKINSAAGVVVLKGEYSGLRRMRIGSYRVIYEVQDQKLIILVIRIGHRREVYR